MPSQRELSSIVARCSSLSEQWYGRPCLSIVFAFLVELASCSCTEGARSRSCSVAFWQSIVIVMERERMLMMASDPRLLVELDTDVALERWLRARARRQHSLDRHCRGSCG